MKVKLLNATPINIALEAGLICTDSEDRISQYNATEFISKLLEQGHESVIEHLNYSFIVEGISRAMLQELARHRHISLSVKSTRWALKKIKDKIHFYNPMLFNEYLLCSLDKNKIKELEESQNFKFDALNDNQCNTIHNHYEILSKLNFKIEEIKDLIKEGIDEGLTNDILKYYLPECLTTKLILTLNARELRHIFELRTSKRALREFRCFCAILYKTLPKEHKFIYDEVLSLSDNDIEIFNDEQQYIEEFSV